MHEKISTGFYMLIFVVFALVLSGSILLVSKVMSDWEKRDERKRSDDYQPPENEKP